MQFRIWAWGVGCMIWGSGFGVEGIWRLEVKREVQSWGFRGFGV